MDVVKCCGTITVVNIVEWLQGHIYTILVILQFTLATNYLSDVQELAYRPKPLLCILVKRLRAQYSLIYY